MEELKINIDTLMQQLENCYFEDGLILISREKLGYMIDDSEEKIEYLTKE